MSDSPIATIDLNLLPVFIAVADRLSFSAAATRLGITRASASRGVAALEAGLGTQLFHRTTRKVALTTAGKALYARVVPTMAQLGEVLGGLSQREHEVSGRLRLTASVDFGSTYLPEVVAAFSARHPNVVTQLHLTGEIVDLVTDRYDCALRITRGRAPSSSLVRRRISELDAQVCASPEYLAAHGVPRSIGDLTGHGWVAFRDERLPPPLASVSGAVRVRVVCDDLLFVRHAVRAGLGLSIMPTYLAREDLAAGRLVRVLSDVALPTGSLQLVYPPARRVPARVEAFRDFLLAYVAGHPLRANSL